MFLKRSYFFSNVMFNRNILLKNNTFSQYGIYINGSILTFHVLEYNTLFKYNKYVYAFVLVNI